MQDAVRSSWILGDQTRISWNLGLAFLVEKKYFKVNVQAQTEEDTFSILYFDSDFLMAKARQT